MKKTTIRILPAAGAAAAGLALSNVPYPDMPLQRRNHKEEF